MVRNDLSDFVDIGIETRQQVAGFVLIKKGGFLQQQVAMQLDTYIVIGTTAGNPKQRPAQSGKECRQCRGHQQTRDGRNHFTETRIQSRHQLDALSVIVWNERNEQRAGCE